MIHEMKKYCKPLVQSSRLKAEYNFCNSTRSTLSDWEYDNVYVEEEE